MCSRLLLAGAVSETFLVFNGLDSSGEYWSYRRMPFYWDFSDIFILVSLRLKVIGRKTIEVKCHFQHFMLRVHNGSTRVIVDVGLDHLAKVTVVRLLHCQATLFSPFSKYTSSKVITLHSSHLRNRSFSLPL